MALAALFQVIKRETDSEQKLCLTYEEERELSDKLDPDVEAIISRVRSAAIEALDLNEQDVFAKHGYQLRALFEQVTAIETGRNLEETAGNSDYWPRDRFVRAHARFESFAERTKLFQRGRRSLDHRLRYGWPVDEATRIKSNRDFLERFKVLERCLTWCLKYKTTKRGDPRWGEYFEGWTGESLATYAELSVGCVDRMDSLLGLYVFLVKADKFLQPLSWSYWLRHLTKAK